MQALMLAANLGKFEIVRLLVSEYGVDPNDQTEVICATSVLMVTAEYVVPVLAWGDCPYGCCHLESPQNCEAADC